MDYAEISEVDKKPTTDMFINESLYPKSAYYNMTRRFPAIQPTYDNLRER